MSFFDSEIVRAEMAEISELQEDVYGQIMKFQFMNNEDKAYHIGLLEKLLNKQQIIYARLSLSDDPEAKRMKQEIARSATLMGLPSNVDMSVLFKQMSQMVDLMKKQLDTNQVD
tara:strand:+ start:271 stop:612 length:342 start_codon:yes stop_codon:yes gene_type:complete